MINDACAHAMPMLNASLLHAAPLANQVAALEPQQDPAHRGLHRDVRGVPGDRAPLRVVEIFLLHLLDQEEGERLGDPSADRMCGHPPLGERSRWWTRGGEYSFLNLITLANRNKCGIKTIGLAQATPLY